MMFLPGCFRYIQDRYETVFFAGAMPTPLAAQWYGYAGMMRRISLSVTARALPGTVK
jgi:hypothetical protein